MYVWQQVIKRLVIKDLLFSSFFWSFEQVLLKWHEKSYFYFIVFLPQVHAYVVSLSDNHRKLQISEYAKKFSKFISTIKIGKNHAFPQWQRVFA